MVRKSNTNANGFDNASMLIMKPYANMITQYEMIGVMAILAYDTYVTNLAALQNPCPSICVQLSIFLQRMDQPSPSFSGSISFKMCGKSAEIYPSDLAKRPINGCHGQCMRLNLSLIYIGRFQNACMAYT